MPQYNENNELLDSVEYTHEYDDNGSLVAEYHPDGTLYRSFDYNAENRMSAVRDQDGVLIAEYLYDPFGRRVNKTLYDPPGENPETTWYVYSDQGLMAEVDETGQETNFYLFPPDGLWSTDPILRKSSSSYYYYQTDHLGTPQQLIDGTGAVVHSREMRAFGEVATTGIKDNWRFPGQLASSEIEFYYNYFRDYAPQAGRYVQRDPIGVNGGRNLYKYANANPTILVDHYGLEAQCFNSKSEALEAAVRMANETTFGEGSFVREWCGLVYYKECEEEYCLSELTSHRVGADFQNKKSKCPLPCSGLGIPEEHEVVAGFHSHGKFSFLANREEFSKNDRSWAKRCGVDLHLATPCGQHKKVSPSGNEQIIGGVGSLPMDPRATVEACEDQLTWGSP